MSRRTPRILHPMQRLPEGYRLRASFSLSLTRPWVLIGLNLLGGLIFFLAGWWLLDRALQTRPELADELIRLSTNANLLFLAGNVAGLVVGVVLHELVHGLLFWFLTGAPPRFGFRIVYAFAAAPEWYLPRMPYASVALAPLILLTALGLWAQTVLPNVLQPALLFAMITNIAGSVGDLAVVVWLFTKPAKLLAQDLGDSINLFW